MAIDLQARSPTTSTWPTTASSSARWRSGSPTSSSGGWRRARATSRTTTSTCAPPSASGKGGWANFGHVKMPDYRWGIFLAEPEPERKIGFGEHARRAGVAAGPRRAARAAAAAHRHPGRHRAGQRRAAAAARAHGALALRSAEPLPGQRGGGPAPVGDGLPAAQVLRRGRPRRGRGSAAPPLRRRGQPAHPPGVQQARGGLADVLLLHRVHRPRRQVPARRAGRERVRSAGAHHASSCSRRRRTTSPSGRTASAAWCSAPPS